MADEDGDGVHDCDDLCEGYDDNIDMDGDGVPDGCDLCPLVLGDLTGDTSVDADDIAPFVGLLLGEENPNACAADLSADGLVDGRDIGPFVTLLLMP